MTQNTNNSSRKLNRFARKYLTADFIKLILVLIIIAILLYHNAQYHDYSWRDMIDVTVVLSFLAVFLAESIARLLGNWIGKVTEDSVKVRSDSEFLVKKYAVDRPNMVIAKNGVDSEGKRVDVVYPELVLVKHKLDESAFDFEIEYDESLNYTLPGQVAEHSGEIIDAHRHSVVYNNRNIRLSDFAYDRAKNCVKLTYSFTTYYDSLMTNRAMDFPFDGDRTIREIYEPGPMISTLKDSKLSNHLGFNGFVELADGKIIFVHRGKAVSIGKETWAQSIGASLKAAYALNAEHRFTYEGMIEAIRGEILDELKMDVKAEELKDSIFAFYRDLAEGGKPQFLFYYKSETVDSKAFEVHFRQVMKDKNVQKENKKKQVVDGTEFLFLTWEDLRTAGFGNEGLILTNGTKMRMVPSALASVAMLLECKGE